LTAQSYEWTAETNHISVSVFCWYFIDVSQFNAQKIVPQIFEIPADFEW
jgi:hypothetical protein